jgi:DNA repair protein SbcD/Mre11
MKLLYFTDPHVMGKNPRSRKDDFPHTILRKIEWVMNYAFDNNISTILVGGDLFHRPDTAESIVYDVIKIITKYNGIKMYGIGGNHDFYGYNPQTIPRTMLGILSSTKVYELINPERPLVIEDVVISGQHADYRLDRGNEWGYVGVNKRDYEAFKSIHVCHGFLADHRWPDTVPHTIIYDIADKVEADIVLTGHDHAGFGIIETKGKTFCNPGALGRISAAVGEMNREVNVCVIDTDENTVVLVPVEIALPADEILDREELEKEKVQAQSMQYFIAEVGEFVVESSNTLDVIESIANKEDLDPDIIAEAISRVQKAHEAIGGNI